MCALLCPKDDLNKFTTHPKLIHVLVRSHDTVVILQGEIVVYAVYIHTKIVYIC